MVGFMTRTDQVVGATTEYATNPWDIIEIGRLLDWGESFDCLDS